MLTKQLKYLWVLTIAALLVMLVYLSNHLSALIAVDEDSIPGCTLDKGRCNLTLNTGEQITLVASPWPVVALKPVEFQIISDRLSLSSAEMSLTARNMYMGIHRYNLQPKHNQQTLSVQGTISVCTEAVMPWRGRVELKTPKGSEYVWFDFDVLQK